MNQKNHGLFFSADIRHHGELLYAYLKREAKASKPVIQYWIANEKVKVNHKSVNHNVRLESGDSVMIDLREEEESGIVPEYGELPVLFEDDHMLIVNKPAGMATHPNEAGQTGTLSNLVAFYFQMNGEERKVRHVHRLDKDTSGAVVFAKHRLAHALLDEQPQRKELARTYVAVAEGKFRKKREPFRRQSAETSTTPSEEGCPIPDSPLSPILNRKDMTAVTMLHCADFS